MVKSGKRLVLICSLLVPDTPAKFYRPSSSGSAPTSKTVTEKPTEIAIAICHLVNTKCNNKNVDLLVKKEYVA